MNLRVTKSHRSQCRSVVIFVWQYYERLQKNELADKGMNRNSNFRTQRIHSQSRNQLWSIVTCVISVAVTRLLTLCYFNWKTWITKFIQWTITDFTLMLKDFRTEPCMLGALITRKKSICHYLCDNRLSWTHVVTPFRLTYCNSSCISWLCMQKACLNPTSSSNIISSNGSCYKCKPMCRGLWYTLRATQLICQKTWSRYDINGTATSSCDFYIFI